jgi:hypothetical protein
MCKPLFALILLHSLCLNGVNAFADAPPMAIENGGRMEFFHAARQGTLNAAQKAALEARLIAECSRPTNPITQGMIETRGPGKCMAFVRNQCQCADCEMPSYCLPNDTPP